MDPNIITIIAAIAALVVGIIAGKFIFAKDTRKRIEEAELQAQTLIKEAGLRAETIRKEKELEAKERFVQLKGEHEREVLERNRKVGEGENRIRQKEQSVNQKTEMMPSSKTSIVRSRW
jgi:ribonucrease Y